MEIFLWLCVMLVAGTSAAEVDETTTTFFLETTEPATESPSNGSTAVSDAPLENNPHYTFDGVESKEESAAATQPVVVEFPENHRNFTSSEFLGDDTQFPYYNRLNEHQQQYKAYFEQKQLFNRKPIKFEENSVKNFYGWEAGKDGYGHHAAEEEKKQGTPRKPFPYAFEQDSVGNWYKQQAGAGVVHEEPKGELVWRGHFFPQGHPHEQKLYKTEPVTHVHHGMKKSEGSPWKKVFHLLTALVPLGLILASLTPNVISVNSTAATKNSRQRSEDSLPIKYSKKDVTKIMDELGVQSLSEAQCEDRVICELGRRGDAGTAGSIEKGFWFLANETPWDAAERAGLNDLFKAIRTGTCESFKCYGSSKTTRKSGLAKKFIRKRKIPDK